MARAGTTNPKKGQRNGKRRASQVPQKGVKHSQKRVKNRQIFIIFPAMQKGWGTNGKGRGTAKTAFFNGLGVGGLGGIEGVPAVFDQIFAFRCPLQGARGEGEIWKKFRTIFFNKKFKRVLKAL